MTSDERALFEEAPCGLMSCMPDGTIVRANRTLLRWTGYEPESVIRRMRIQDLLAPGDRIYYETHFAPLLFMQGHVQGVAVEVVAADGRRLPAFLAAVVDRAGDGEPAAIRTAVVDAADRRAYEHELLREMRRAEESEARARLLAQTLQQSLVPPTPPSIPGLDVAAVYRPAGAGDEVGGDFYDVFEMSHAAWGVVVGDVAGKGAEAAVVTSLARHTVRAAAMRSSGPKDVLRVLNAALLRGGSERLCSAVFANVEPGDGEVRVRFSAAGHPLPILAGARGVHAVGRPGMLLGLDEDAPLADDDVTLTGGEALVLYTDGITEARRGDEWFGEERLEDALRGMAGARASEIAEDLLEAALTFQAGFPRDDIAIVVLARA